MPNSLRNKIKHLAYKGELNERERDRILNALDREVKWIPCDKELPEIGQDILFCDIDGDIYVGHRTKYYWWSVDDKVKCVIAWAYLPAPYQPPTMMCEED